MEVIVRVAAVAVTASVCAVLLRRQAGELAVLLAVGACAVVMWMVLSQLTALVALLRRLMDAAQVDSALVEPLFKTVAVSIVTAVTAGVARDAGQSSIATVVQFAGALVALCLAAPLVEAALRLLEGML